jgi:hypothetical protein
MIYDLAPLPERYCNNEITRQPEHHALLAAATPGDMISSTPDTDSDADADAVFFSGLSRDKNPSQEI